jgi:5'-nucleotidase
VARFATVVSNLRDASAASLLVSAGDAFSASAEFDASLERGVPFYDALGMDLLGLEASAVGNQDFDFGPDVFASFLASFTRFVPYLSCNLNFEGEPALAAYHATGQLADSAVFVKNGTPIGLVGVTTERLPFISSPRNVTVDENTAAAVQQEIDDLTAQGVSIIIVLNHMETLEQNRDLLTQIRGVDIVVTATPFEILADPGTLLVPGDEQYVVGDYPAIAQDADGRDVPVVSTGGNYKYVGRLIADFDSGGNLLSVAEASGPVRVAGGSQDDAVTPNPLVEELVTQPVSAFLEQRAETVVATSQVALDATASALLSRETNVGNLVADALLQQGVQLASQFSVNEPEVAIVNGGGIPSDEVLPAGNITALDVGELLPFASFLAVVEDVSPQKFKQLLENAVSAVEENEGRFAQVAGFSFEWDPSGTAQQVNDQGDITVAGTRVRKVTLDSGAVIVSGGQVQANAPSIDLATIDFVARGGDQYPFDGADFTVLGITYQTALLNYLADALNGVITSTMYPEGGEGRITSL